MSKQSLEKYKQGYTDKAMLPVCMNCLHYHSEMKQVQGYYNIGELAEKNKSCKLGNFVVKKMATCNKFQFKSISSSPDVQPDGPRGDAKYTNGCQTNKEAAPMSGYAVPSRAAGGEDQKI